MLADDLLVQLVFHLEEPSGLVVLEAFERHAGHLADDFGDHFLIDDAVDFLRLLSPFAGDAFFLLLEFVGLIAKMGGLFKILLGDSRFLLLVELLDLGIQFL